MVTIGAWNDGRDWIWNWSLTSATLAARGTTETAEKDIKARIGKQQQCLENEKDMEE